MPGTETKLSARGPRAAFSSFRSFFGKRYVLVADQVPESPLSQPVEVVV